jgi:hypothetical protein
VKVILAGHLKEGVNRGENANRHRCNLRVIHTTASAVQ